jgi:hypothetical protein
MMTIRIVDRAGAFAENKDVARDIRLREIVPALERQEEVTLDFTGVDSATQSFIHALLSEALRTHGGDALDRIAFKSCSINVKKIIEIVVAYTQEGMDFGPEHP